MKKLKQDNSKVNQDAMKKAKKLMHAAYLKMTYAEEELEELKQKLPHDGVLSAFLTNCAKSLDFVTFGSLDYRKLMPVLVGLRDATTKGTRVFLYFVCCVAFLLTHLILKNALSKILPSH